METPPVNSPIPVSPRSASSARARKPVAAPERSSCKPRRRTTRTPAALTGCVSKLSAIERQEHAYFDALKDYAEHYAEAQDYLVDEEWQIVHDYALIRRLLREPERAPSDAAEATPSVTVSDDDIDYCGYLAWLRHK